MTTVASPETVRPQFSGTVMARGRAVTLERVGDEFWATFDDPDAVVVSGLPGLSAVEGSRTRTPRIRRQIVLITGSHHQQVFWYATGRKRLLGLLPITYLIAEQRWIPRRAAFMHPPVEGHMSETGHWSAICVGCHATNGKPRIGRPPGTEPLDQADVDTHVAEFGIACEACHGPAAAHVRANGNPLRRLRGWLSNASDDTIVQPKRLDPRKASEVCGQCHSVWELPDAASERRENTGGVAYKPGGDLRASRFIAEPARVPDAPRLGELLRDDPNFVSESFWPDGMISVSGREYNGLIESPCFVKGTMTCLSCHQMHKPEDDKRSLDAWANDQLRNGMDGNDACVQCHTSFRSAPAVEAHTHHPAASSGSQCMNCHMPYTTYGLLKTIRSHQISSPDVRTTLATGRPDACNLCHLNKSLGWAGQRLASWFGTPAPQMADDERTIPAGVLWMLRGDAAQRAIAASSAGWAPAQQVSGTAWMKPVLSALLEDRYEAVRFIAQRSLRTVPANQGADGRAPIVDALTRERLLLQRNDRRVFLRE